MSERHLVLIDLSSIWRAAWHSSADQELSAAFEKTIARVHRHINDAQCTHAAVCLDSPPYVHRKAILPEYKAQRDKPPAAMLEQYRRVLERLRADGLLLWEAKGFEADDVIAAATTRAVVDGFEVTIVSADKDLLQLVSDNVRVFSPASETYYDAAKVIEKFGVHPRDMLDLLSLMGDKSDNVPGIEGVGPQKAAKLLATWGNLHEVLANADKNTNADGKPSKLCEALISGAENARRARQVIVLRDDVPIRFEELFEERKAKPLKEVQMPGRDDGFDEREETDDAEFEDMISKPKAPSQPPPAAEAPAPEPKSEPRASAPKPEGPKRDALAKTQPTGEWSQLLEPRNLKQAWWLAEQMANSRLFSKFASAEQAYMVMLRGRALGLDAVTAASAFHNIDGQLAMHADLIEALVLRSGLAEYFDLVETTRQRATYATKRKGARREVTITFTIEDAFHAQLVEKHASGIDGYRGISKTGKASNWDKVRPTMLRHRAKTQLCRAVYADVVLGLYSPDELSDGRDVIDADFEAA